MADKYHSSVHQVLDSVKHLERSLSTAVAFQDKPATQKPFFGCHARNRKWQPPVCSDVSLYCRLLRESLLQYEPLPRRKNEDLVDRAAKRWLSDHQHEVVVVDSDKGLGDVVLSRKWVRDKCLALLREASAPFTSDSYMATTTSMKFEFDSVITLAMNDGHIPQSVQSFLLEDFGSSVPGSLRLRVKIHKTPMGARPVMNMSKSWLRNIASFLVVALQPVLVYTSSVVQSSSSFVGDATSWYVPEGYFPCTIDIKNLYPSVCHRHFLEQFSARLRKFWPRRHGYVSFLINLTSLLLRTQFVSFEGSIWHVEQGFATGLQCGVVFANIYLTEFDDFLIRTCSDMGFRVLGWRRFIDDGFCLLPFHSSPTLIGFANSWNAQIIWELSGHDAAVPFLDLQISVQQHRLHFQTNRKPQNIYAYLPRSSCHPPSVFESLVTGETTRLHRTNYRNNASFHEQVEFFVEKLCRRGYNSLQARKLIERTSRRLRMNQKRPSSRTRKFFFKQTFSSTLNVKVIKKSLKKNWHLIQGLFRSPVDVMMCYKIQPNDFRRNFATNWVYKPLSARAG